MNKNTIRSTVRAGILSMGITTAVLIASFFGIETAQAAITSHLDLGDRGSNVTELQTYLSTSGDIYPSKLVTGYFGSLTQAGVQRFQTAQNIVSSGSPATTGYGRVGNITMTRINALMGGSQTYLDTVPVLSTPLIQTSRTTATLTWASNEATHGQVYYDTVAIRASEATGPHQQPYVSGILVSNNTGLQTTHTVTISNLQSDTVYYFVTRGIDSVGNTSMTWPSTFRTN